MRIRSATSWRASRRGRRSPPARNPPSLPPAARPAPRAPPRLPRPPKDRQPRSAALRCGRFSFEMDRPLVMGVVNITPDSFSDGGRFLERDAAIAHARRLAAEGADIIDIGGESTRPGAAPVSETQELARIMPVLEKI